MGASTLQKIALGTTAAILLFFQISNTDVFTAFKMYQVEINDDYLKAFRAVATFGSMTLIANVMLILVLIFTMSRASSARLACVIVGLHWLASIPMDLQTAKDWQVHGVEVDLAPMLIMSGVLAALCFAGALTAGKDDSDVAGTNLALKAGVFFNVAVLLFNGTQLLILQEDWWKVVGYAPVMTAENLHLFRHSALGNGASLASCAVLSLAMINDYKAAAAVMNLSVVTTVGWAGQNMLNLMRSDEWGLDADAGDFYLLFGVMFVIYAVISLFLAGPSGAAADSAKDKGE